MSPRRLSHVAVIGFLVTGAAAAVAFNGNPPVSRTGAPAIGGKPAESTCAGCHGDFALNTAPGSIQVFGAPTYFQPGITYRLTVQDNCTLTAGSPNPLVWGFEMTAVKMSDGTGAGTWANVTGQGTSIAAGSGSLATRSYIRFNTVNYAGSASPVSWQVDWTAPAAGTGSVSFYAVGVAGDGDGGTGGDYVYTTSVAMTDTTTAARPTTWGRLKSAYR